MTAHGALTVVLNPCYESWALWELDGKHGLSPQKRAKTVIILQVSREPRQGAGLWESPNAWSKYPGLEAWPCCSLQNGSLRKHGRVNEAARIP